jgi:hypothetical protein
LFITGGGNPAGREVDKIDTRREFAVSRQPPMLTPRRAHASVYHAQVLYVLGGYSESRLKECERYVCAESRWEVVSPMPEGVFCLSGVVVEGSLYALGGFSLGNLNFIQKLSLERLTWERIEIGLPNLGPAIPCFKLKDAEVYLAFNETLYCLQPLRKLKSLPEGIHSWYGPSYYSRGTLYCSNHRGAAKRLKISSLD